MVLSAEALMDFPIPEARQTVAARDAILYALTVGYGAEPLDDAHLKYTQEAGLVPAPTLANVVCHAGPWMKAAGTDWQKIVHSEQRLTIHRPVPLDMPLVSRSRMLSVTDRGTDRGMFATFERVISTVSDERPVATIIQTNACRGDGGCGSAGIPPAPLPAVPQREPDAVFTTTLGQDAALLYRLNGDLNPLHSDPDYAVRAGFPRPILHGLCTFGHAAYAIGRSFGSPGIADVAAIAARFTGVVLPGDRLEFQMWRDGGDIRFRTQVPERGVTALDCGTARLA